MRILSVHSVFQCKGCDLRLAKVNLDNPRHRRAEHRVIRQAREAGWLVRWHKKRAHMLCPACRKVFVARGFSRCDDATAPERFVKKACILMKGHPGRHANANGGRWGEDRERVAEPGLAPIRKMGGFKEAM